MGMNYEQGLFPEGSQLFWQWERRSHQRNSPLVIRYTFVNTPRLRLNSQFAMLSIKSVNCVILQSLDNLNTVAALS